MTPNQFARHCGVSRSLVMRWITDGLLNVSKVKAPTTTGYYYKIMDRQRPGSKK